VISESHPGQRPPDGSLRTVDAGAGRIVLLGGECTGKSTLAEAISERFGFPVAPEAARELVSRWGRGLEESDVEEVANLQLELASAAANPAGGWSVHDTDLVATAVYAAHYFGGCPYWILRRALQDAAELYVLCSPNGIPFQAEEGQRGTAEDRKEVQCRFDGILRRLRRPVVRVSGPVAERLETVSRALSAAIRARGERP
jgi:nicotinamide riboside kinase